MTDEPRIQRLSQLCWQAVTTRPCIVSGTVIGFPEFCPSDTIVSDGRYDDHYPVLRYLDEALKGAEKSGFGEISELFFQLPRELVRWSQNPAYNRDNCSQSLLDGYAYAPLSGPDGPIYAAAPRGGFLLMGPNVFYPDHHHQPREFYLVLSGTIEWRLDEGEWFNVNAGSVIYHDSWVKHGMRTADEPVLTFVGWIEPGQRTAVQFTTSV